MSALCSKQVQAFTVQGLPVGHRIPRSALEHRCPSIFRTDAAPLQHATLHHRSVKQSRRLLAPRAATATSPNPSTATLAKKFSELLQHTQPELPLSLGNLSYIPDAVEVTENDKGLKKVVLKHASGTTAEVYLFGACVTSWKQNSGDEVLFIRPDAKFDGSKPISGGIPHCFPQFGPGKMQQHGFARNLEWTLSSTSADLQPDERDPEVTLVLEESEYTQKMWPHKFKAVYSVSLHGDQLRTDFRVINTCDKALDFTAALHSYFEVQDILLAKVEGLQGLQFLDKVVDPNNPVKKKEEREFVMFEGPADSVYVNAPERIALDVGTGAAVQIVSKGWKDVVVWNPWESMPDCYKNFACVENAHFATPVKLQPGEDWRAEQEFTVVDL